MHWIYNLCSPDRRNVDLFGIVEGIPIEGRNPRQRVIFPNLQLTPEVSNDFVIVIKSFVQKIIIDVFLPRLLEDPLKGRRLSVPHYEICFVQGQTIFVHQISVVGDEV